MSDIFEETWDLVDKSMIPYTKLAIKSGVPENWIIRFMNKKADTPNLAYTKQLNKFMKEHAASLQG